MNFEIKNQQVISLIRTRQNYKKIIIVSNMSSRKKNGSTSTKEEQLVRPQEYELIDDVKCCQTFGDKLCKTLNKLVASKKYPPGLIPVTDLVLCKTFTKCKGGKLYSKCVSNWHERCQKCQNAKELANSQKISSSCSPAFDFDQFLIEDAKLDAEIAPEDEIVITNRSSKVC